LRKGAAIHLAAANALSDEKTAGDGGYN
jgi:hypothetical protein